MIVEYVDESNHRALYRDRDIPCVPPVGAFIRFPSDKVWEVTGHMFDYQMNPELWVCVLVKPREKKS